MQGTVGIDVSKAPLDAYWLSGTQHLLCSNDESGLKRLFRLLCKAKAASTLFEATGVYDRLLQAQLATQGMPLVRINPKQALRLAEDIGRLAKVVKVNAALFARMGSLLDNEHKKPWAQSANDLDDLATTLQTLIKDRTAAKARAQITTIPLLETRFGRSLKQIEQDLVRVEAAILSLIAQDEGLSESADTLTSIPGIATTTACAMRTETPELENFSGNQAASPAELAPMSR